MAAENKRHHQPQRSVKKADHNQRHGNDIHGDQAGHTEEGGNADHQAGPRIKAHFQPLRQGVGTRASNIRTGQQAVYPITNDRRQTNAPHPAKKAVLNGQARDNAGDAAGKRDPTNPGNTGEQTDLAAGKQIIGIGRNPAFGIPTQRPENSDQDENGQAGDKHGLPCPLASSISVPCPDSVSKPEDTRRTGFDALRLT